jgi:hypothetical protein
MRRFVNKTLGMVKRLFLYERKKMLKRIENMCKRKEKEIY